MLKERGKNVEFFRLDKYEYDSWYFVFGFCSSMRMENKKITVKSFYNRARPYIDYEKPNGCQKVIKRKSKIKYYKTLVHER